jgi:hypothetical protein
MKMTLTALCPARTLTLSAALGLFLAAPVLSHAQYQVSGDFNGWSTTASPMVSQGDNLYTYQATGLTAGQLYSFKINVGDWSASWPGTDARVMADSNGEITFRFFDSETWNDGWGPVSTRRVGYSDSGLHGWDVAGTMNGWNGAGWELTHMGNGLYRGEFLLQAGNYDFKFRKADDWGVSLGTDFGNSAGDISFTAETSNIYVFQLDLWNGRHQVEVIPEPSTYAAIFGGLALLGAFLYRRRQTSKA